MIRPRRRFTMSPPNWGEGHLAADAVVAYVDDELAPSARERAAAHLERCSDCSSEVATQAQARAALRSAAGPMLPPSLMSTLRAIPHDADVTGPPAGLAVTANGELVTVLDDHHHTPPVDAHRAQSGSQSHRSRVARVGAVAAVSGLALGVLALGLPLVIDATQSSPRGVFGGPLLDTTLSGVEARFDVSSTEAEVPDAFDARLWQRLGSLPPVLGFPLRP